MKAVEGSTAFFLEKILESQDHDTLPQTLTWTSLIFQLKTLVQLCSKLNDLLKDYDSKTYLTSLV